MGKLIDLTGQRFGRLTVIERAEDYISPQGIKHVRWCCRCDCGNAHTVAGLDLRRGKTISCGCFHNELLSARVTSHKKCDTRLYRIWKNMRNRCYDPQNNRYYRYGGRGITVCEEWLHDFKAFYDWAMANGYQDDLSIDRIDNDKGYSPDNCRWETAKEQNRNKSALCSSALCSPPSGSRRQRDAYHPAPSG